MTANLIPQDELTLDLLAKILAKMYWHSLNSRDEAPAEAVEPDVASSANIGDCDEPPTVDGDQHDEKGRCLELE